MGKKYTFSRHCIKSIQNTQLFGVFNIILELKIEVMKKMPVFFTLKGHFRKTGVVYAHVPGSYNILWKLFK